MNRDKKWAKWLVQAGALLILSACSGADKTAQDEGSKQTPVVAAKVAQADETAAMDQPKQQAKRPQLVKSKKKSLCPSMFIKRCLGSSMCVWDQDENKKYACRDAANDCELGFVQVSDDKAAVCNAKPGCRFKPASCFCPPGVTCICGGGKPSACVATEQG